MPKQITLTIPDKDYDNYLRLDAATKQSAVDLFLQRIRSAETRFPTYEDGSIEQEMAAFIDLHPQLVKTHLGKYVAIVGGQLVDSDEDVVTLIQRTKRYFPDQTVIHPLVKEKAIEEIVWRKLTTE